MVFLEVLRCMNLTLDDARGQCFDGAKTMTGYRNGVVTNIKQMNNLCLYTHCYGHALNLAVGDSVCNVRLLSDTFDSVKEICNLIKNSPKRDSHLKIERIFSSNEYKGVHSFCPTRWTTRAESCSAILNNYMEIEALWEWSLKYVTDTTMKARIRGGQLVQIHAVERLYCIRGARGCQANCPNTHYTPE